MLHHKFFSFAGVVILLLLVIRIILFPRSSFKRRKHQYKIHKAKTILKKFERFESEHRNAQIITYLRKIDPYVFEELLLEAFLAKGYSIKRNKSYSNDGGIDGLIFNKKREPVFIQAKRYSNAITSKHIHDLRDKVVLNNAAGGYFIHTGKTPAAVYAAYRDSDITIISGTKLVELITLTQIINPKEKHN